VSVLPPHPLNICSGNAEGINQSLVDFLKKLSGVVALVRITVRYLEVQLCWIV